MLQTFSLPLSSPLPRSKTATWPEIGAWSPSTPEAARASGPAQATYRCSSALPSTEVTFDLEASMSTSMTPTQDTQKFFRALLMVAFAFFNRSL